MEECMAFPNSSISDLVATTIEYRSKTIADNVTAQNAVLTSLSDSGDAVLSGGTQIFEIFSFAENSNGGSYSGYDTLPTGTSDVISGANFPLQQYAVPITFSGRDELINSGPEALLNLVKARVKVAEATMQNLLNRHLYLDGTGNGGKNVTGLAAAVATSPTNVYGGINRSDAGSAFWKNKTWNATADGSGVATTSTIQAQFTQAYLRTVRGKDKTKLIIAGASLYSTYEGSLQANLRYSDAKLANAGFTNIKFKDTPVVYEDAASGIAATTGYFLNTDYLHWRTHADRNMVMLKDKQSINQDATVRTLVWAGNLTCSGAKFQLVFTNT